MEAQATWIKEHKLLLKAQGQAFLADVCDEKRSEHCPPSPVDYFLASYAGCVASHIVQTLQNHEVEPEGLRVQVQAEYGEDSHRIVKFHVEVDLPEGLTGSLERLARRAGEGCALHRTLAHPPQVEFSYHPASNQEVLWKTG